MQALDLIIKRRDGQPHTPEELAFLARGAADGSIPDYQLSAWLMAAFLHPLDLDETASMTVALADSGRRLDLSDLPAPRLDKHSTGGVGDKVTLILLPLLASCGVSIVKMSGRGLGITGGTVDKLASIPGFRIDLSPEELLAQAGRIGVALTGQTPALAPADKALYALRDVTGTVNSIPLIVSSILSKKLAGGAESVLLDVKCGSGGFMRSLDEAKELAGSLLEVGRRCGLNLRLALTDMDQPLGKAVGNALEVKEAIATLKGRETGRLSELCLALACEALSVCGKAPDMHRATDMAREALKSGAARLKAMDWIEAQGGDLGIFESEDWARAPVVKEIRHAGDEGYAHRVDARTVGQCALELGAGRKEKEDAIDPRVGVETYKQIGDLCLAGDLLFVVHAATQEAAEKAGDHLLSALKVGRDPVPPIKPLIEAMR